MNEQRVHRCNKVERLPKPTRTTVSRVTVPVSTRQIVSMASSPRAGGAAQRPNGATQNKICQFKLVLLGESAVGKSSLVLRFVKGQFHEYQESTIGAAFLTQTLCIDDTTVKFEIWDTAGQERYCNPSPPALAPKSSNYLNFPLRFAVQSLQVPQFGAHVLPRCTGRDRGVRYSKQ